MRPELSVIIPVYRESAVIRETLQALVRLEIPLAFEVLVVDGEPGAPTLEALTSGCVKAWPRMRVRPVKAPRGRGPQMNAGAEAALGDLYLFLHADTRISRAGMAQMTRTWSAANPQNFCGAFDLAIDHPGPAFRLIERTASLRSRLTRIPYGDQAIFISRPLFEKVGGFPQVPIMEDVGLMSAVKRNGTRPVFMDHAAVTSARRWQDQGLVYTTLRNWTLICLYMLGADPRHLARFY